QVRRAGVRRLLAPVRAPARDAAASGDRPAWRAIGLAPVAGRFALAALQVDGRALADPPAGPRWPPARRAVVSPGQAADRLARDRLRAEPTRRRDRAGRRGRPGPSRSLLRLASVRASVCRAVRASTMKADTVRQSRNPRVTSRPCTERRRVDRLTL